MEKNNFSNGFYGEEPQKPFTEKPENSQQSLGQPAPFIAQPEQSSESSSQLFETYETVQDNSFSSAQNNYNTSATDNNTSEQTTQTSSQNTDRDNSNNFGTYNTQNQYQPNGFANNDYSQPAYQQNGFTNNDYSQPVYQQNGFTNNDYSQPVYQQNGYSYNPSAYNPVQPQHFTPQGQPLPPQNSPYNQQTPVYDGNAHNAQPINGGYGAQNGQPYAPNIPCTPPAPAKKKMSAGLIVVIVVLCVLLLGSVIGIVTYITYNNNQKNSLPSNNSFDSYSFTLPDSGSNGGGYNYSYEQETTAPSVHEETDYSDKTDSSYSGLKLNSKPKDASTNSAYTSEYAFNKVSDSVVGVVCYTNEITSVEYCSSQGSGIIISSDGYVLTNAHVIGNSKTAYLIQIVTSNGKTYTAGVVGYDTRTDIAVLKADDAKNLTPATFGDSDSIELGEDIIAVGNPGGLDYQNSITKGVVSAVNRELSSSSLVKYIQTDAAINPGNSGGPIVNLYGQVIGVATSKIVSEKYEGMGFAIPSATVSEIVNSLIKNGYVAGRVKIGITGGTVSASTAQSYNIPQGILVQNITSGGPCDGTELEVGDIITEADGQTVTSFSDIYEILEEYNPGDKITLKYYRTSDGTEGSIEITLQEDKL